MSGIKLKWAGHVWKAKNTIDKTVPINDINKKRLTEAIMVGCSKKENNRFDMD